MQVSAKPLNECELASHWFPAGERILIYPTAQIRNRIAGNIGKWARGREMNFVDFLLESFHWNSHRREQARQQEGKYTVGLHECQYLN